MNRNIRIPNFASYLGRRPDAFAIVRGSDGYPDILGAVRFFENEYGVIVVTEVRGLPKTTAPCRAPIFALHIHEGGSCSGDTTDPFASAHSHYNPDGCPHPYHAGDLPPLFGSDGYAFGAALTDRFTVDEVIGRTVIIHDSPDDFTSQPSGNAGEKLACGEIISRFSWRR